MLKIKGRIKNLFSILDYGPDLLSLLRRFSDTRDAFCPGNMRVCVSKLVHGAGTAVGWSPQAALLSLMHMRLRVGRANKVRR